MVQCRVNDPTLITGQMYIYIKTEKMGRWIVDMSQTTMSWQSSNLILIIKKRQVRGQTGRTDALLSVSSPWTTHDYLTNKTLNITSINIIMGQQILHSV